MNGMAKKIRAGQIYSDGARAVCVHFIRPPFVYYQEWPAGVDNQSMFERLGRMDLQKFVKALTANGLQLQKQQSK